MKNRSLLPWTMILGCAASLTSCAGTGPTAHLTSTGGSDVLQATLEPYNGSKARLAVAKFTVKAAHGHDAIGEGLADMLATALFQTNRYIVLERQALSHVLAEQDVGASGRVRLVTAARTGEIEGAELLIMGAVTEFEPGNAGAGVSRRSNLGGSLGAAGGTSGMIIGTLLGGLAGSVQKSHVAIDVRIVDTRTSRVVASTSVQGTATDVAGLSTLGGADLGVGLSGYAKTSVEKAVRIALQEGVKFIVSRMPNEYYRYAAEGSTGAAQVKRAVQAGARPAALSHASEPVSETTPLIYVKTALANLREAPDTKSRVVGVLKRGTRATVVDMKPDWYHVKLDDGNAGWVAGSVTTFGPE